MLITLTGDTMLSRPLRAFTEPEYLRLVQWLRDADVSFTNLETTVRRHDEGWAVRTMGTPMSTDPALLAELPWLGVDIVSCANNHATDYGAEGVLATMRHLQSHDIPFAGIGENLARAAAPAYVESKAGRLGLVAATSFLPPDGRAAHQRPDSPGRPGVNPIEFQRKFRVPREDLALIRRMDQALGLRAERTRRMKEFFSAAEVGHDNEEELKFAGISFGAADGYGIDMQPSRLDVEQVLRSIREARSQADYVVFSYHYHELWPSGEAGDTVEIDRPATFVEDVARAAIDAGADVVAGHGPHLTMGIEIHRGKPILYSLGNFIFHNESIDMLPAESYARFGLDHSARPSEFFDARTDHDRKGFPAAREYWESYAAQCSFDGDRLCCLTLLPVDLGFGNRRSQRGRPLQASGDVAQHIVQRLQRLSRRYGTRLEYDGASGLVRVSLDVCAADSP